MPTLADLRVRLTNASRGPSIPAGSDEVLVIDTRSKLSPAQIVEQKLRQVLSAGRARPCGVSEKDATA